MNEFSMKWHDYSQNNWLQKQNILTKSVGENLNKEKNSNKMHT